MESEAEEKPKTATAGNSRRRSSRKPPTPEEVLAHYEAQGLEPREASLKAIRDLQLVLYRAVSATSKGGGGGKKDVDSVRKLENVNARLAILDLKLDSKPGYPATFAIGVGSGLAAQGIGAALPHVVGAIGGIWNSVRSATKNFPPSS